MSSLDRRQTDLAVLHPVFRAMVDKVVADLAAAGNPLEVFEVYRSPDRQRYLYAKGRTAPGSIVTKARPWSSYHQYGLAVDFVLKIGGQWSWDSAGANAKHWQSLHEIGRRHGLEPLSWELPHLQMAGLKNEELRQGLYPPFGDEAWADNLDAAIAGWIGDDAAPPPPALAGRPALPQGDAESGGMDMGTGRDMGAGTAGPALVGGSALDGLNRSGVPSELGETSDMTTNQFARIQSFIDKWEGGYVDHPSDPGGATNMGITLETLSRWRGRAVSKIELKALTRTEQQQIMRAYYYDVVRGDDLPAAVAALVYNAAVLSGPSRAGRFLQTALRAQGMPIAVDGAIGPNTIAAARTADPARTVEDILSIQAAYLRGLPHFGTFGNGWMNRLEDFGDFARTLLAPSTIGNAPPAPTPAPIPVPPTPTTPDGKPPLTPVNAALGAPLGNLVNGRKTAIGLGATLLAALSPEIADFFNANADTLTNVQDIANFVEPLGLATTAWGILGKIEKWIAPQTAVPK